MNNTNDCSLKKEKRMRINRRNNRKKERSFEERKMLKAIEMDTVCVDLRILSLQCYQMTKVDKIEL